MQLLKRVFWLFLMAVGLSLGVVLVMLNAQFTDIDLLLLQFPHVTVGLALVVAFSVGVLLGLLMSSALLQAFKYRSDYKRLERQYNKLDAQQRQAKAPLA